MPDQKHQPQDSDAILGGQSPAPQKSTILGGIEGVKRRLLHQSIAERVAALQEALNYPPTGLFLVIQALKDETQQVRRAAYQLLRDRTEPEVQQALKDYNPWNLIERIIEPLSDGYLYYPFNQFANRSVASFDRQVGISDPTDIAYAVYDNDFKKFLQDPRAGEVEALIFSDRSRYIDDGGYRGSRRELKEASRLRSLKALFIGPYDWDLQISFTHLCDISDVLRAYPNLEMLCLRGGDDDRNPDAPWEEFTTVQHDHLKTLIVETGGLSAEKIAQILTLKLPALEHLELWLGCLDYGGRSSIDDLMPILSGEAFPNLVYLGLRNSEYADEVAVAITQSKIMETIKVLDLSMGVLSDEGAEALLNCPLHQLQILNVSESYLSGSMIDRLQTLGIQVFAQNQKGDEYEDRYCSVAE
ncbi:MULTISPECIES: HEAT repeat domain-containing protein [unclassified Leptolyngbya]|uniref:HEAT repeat domain-containing protein n=1 Tax=unclassified Leptolyngbya TaxID=2650499 RepID=UPI001681EE35|nr:MULTISPECIES: HEAT repeat domain-containing protein [unclassified Leptolyngbya]MBD1914058.1 HEAT repeat domain-containing protein [Leptolyngbya sp. FACHB-8]MBD2152978.1 HEAT repeat domain-containing protein [Leptolyngbya sp. FACHB-16]